MLPLLLLALQAAAPAPVAAPPSPAPAAPAAPAPWAVRERADAANGVLTTTTSVIARDGSSRLIVKCDRGTESIVSVQFITKQVLQTAADTGEFADKQVALRFNGGPAVADNWQFRGSAAFIAAATPVTTLTTGLAKAKTITVETTNSANFAFSATFDGPATDAPVRQVLTACGYTLGTVPPPPAPPAKK
ncbi:hypothetical protein [Sphingomonas alpina]|uniref:Invasion associated locus B family protein n=1 Tax=Sphingomonas alpina TaxID=653931 RepID=A0A7H0LE18_9SPHN|nr:hypothetical protein [Sphingomonas alpina]QNQ07921.1 hypothetical protein H3Z74_14095 [Sphingomonas alpina]